MARASIGGRPLSELVPDLAAAGVDLVQLREKEMEAGDILRAGAPLRDACREAGVAFIINDRPDVALALDADGVHLGQNDLPVQIGRRIVGDAIVGVSTHSEAEIDRASASSQQIDYIAVGPVQETPTKPGRAGTGLELVRYAARVVQVPWFVTGNMNAKTLPDAIEAGARRAVVVRAITEASDPVAAAAQLSEILDEVSV
ncbi:MAG TPA: thiamine phosphate synthase [Actinomycetota bacterium]|nr:thiamine phosphate synthase [Actinomycetota bacterium]